MIDEKALGMALVAAQKASDPPDYYPNKGMITAAITAYLGALDGVVLVPVEPSDKMLEAAYAADEAESTDWLNYEAGPIEAIYLAMLAARPQIEGE